MNIRRKYLPVLFIVLLLTLLAVVTASAAVIWDVNSFSGPNWNGTSYDFTFDVTEFTGGTGDICIRYTVNGGSSIGDSCTCPDCVGEVGTWNCVLPTAPDAQIYWNISGWTGGSCNGSPSLLQEGTINTGPNAIELSSFTIENSQNNLHGAIYIFIICSVAILLLVGLRWLYKSRLKQ